MYKAGTSDNKNNQSIIDKKNNRIPIGRTCSTTL